MERELYCMLRHLGYFRCVSSLPNQVTLPIMFASSAKWGSRIISVVLNSGCILEASGELQKYCLATLQAKSDSLDVRPRHWHFFKSLTRVRNHWTNDFHGSFQLYDSLILILIDLDFFSYLIFTDIQEEKSLLDLINSYGYELCSHYVTIDPHWVVKS